MVGRDLDVAKTEDVVGNGVQNEAQKEVQNEVPNGQVNKEDSSPKVINEPEADVSNKKETDKKGDLSKADEKPGMSYLYVILCGAIPFAFIILWSHAFFMYSRKLKRPFCDKKNDLAKGLAILFTLPIYVPTAMVCAIVDVVKAIKTKRAKKREKDLAKNQDLVKEDNKDVSKEQGIDKQNSVDVNNDMDIASTSGIENSVQNSVQNDEVEKVPTNNEVAEASVPDKVAVIPAEPTSPSGRGMV